MVAGVKVNMSDFLSKDPTEALTQIKDILYERLRSRENYAAQDPLKDQYFKGLQKGAVAEAEFLKNLLDRIERS
jgi:hypothetical protein